MVGEGDRQDRKEAAKLFIAAAVALILLAALGAAGLYYAASVMGAADPFAEGLGLKTAALISFGVSFVAILAPFLVLVAFGFFVWMVVRWRRGRRRVEVDAPQPQR